ncbi:cardiolipin synthase [Haloferula luteola]|uniref:Cardiolipin synthase n=1 Tax=Haloferula luteola TaxID=595692 RepID=A0A840V169_9BACT|nr:cardiolipin synthase [Haloferula luteola]MBB5352097.1 cardiolipin synthase [Haloferula luteola]
MNESHFFTLLWTGLIFVLHLAVAARAVLRPHREPASRMAWIVVILSVPLLGVIAYLLLGETNIGKRRAHAALQAIAQIPPITETPGWDAVAALSSVPDDYDHLFRVGHSVNGFAPVGGNLATLTKDSDAAIDAIIADIDAATSTVHLLYYIWLADHNGLKMVEALRRAASRGVTCRAMADGLGSRAMIDSPHWQSMKEAGVHLAVALPIGNLFVRALKGRIDLRNHRKITVIDNRITYCGSQNCADPAFLVKARYAPWVDILLRFEGPIVRQNQRLFAADWMAEVDEDLSDLLLAPIDPPSSHGFPAQVIGTGPTIRNSAMPEVFESLIYGARKHLFITTPYYVPDESMQEALCACARRGVETTIIFPARNDSFVVGAASRSYYRDLLEAGVRIHEYHGGLLHAKTLTLDGEVTLIGSANMDRRSFDLNYENNILLHDPSTTAALRARQEAFLAESRPVTLEAVNTWPIGIRFRNNLIAMIGPVL